MSWSTHGRHGQAMEKGFSWQSLLIEVKSFPV